MKRHKCIHCSHVITSRFVVCLACRKKKRKWAKKNRPTINKADREWRKQNPQKVKDSKARYRKNYPKKVKQQIDACWEKSKKKYKYNNWRRWLKSKYALTESGFYTALEKQRGLCALCHSKQRCGKRKKLYVDHNHKTNKFRGLVCFKCNVLLGMAQDKVKILKRAIQYLRKHQ